MGRYIDEIDGYISDLFSIVESYASSSNPTEDINQRMIFYGDLQQKIKSIYNSLNLSCLCGEYVEDDKTENKIKDLASKAGDLITLYNDGKE